MRRPRLWRGGLYHRSSIPLLLIVSVVNAHECVPIPPATGVSGTGHLRSLCSLTPDERPFSVLPCRGFLLATSPSIVPVVTPSVAIAPESPSVSNTGSQISHCSFNQRLCTSPPSQAVVYNTHASTSSSKSYSVKALPDNQANVTVVNNPAYLIDARPVQQLGFLF